MKILIEVDPEDTELGEKMLEALGTALCPDRDSNPNHTCTHRWFMTSSFLSEEDAAEWEGIFDE